MATSPWPQSATHRPPRKTSAISSPWVWRDNVSPRASRRTIKLIHSQPTSSRENRSSSVDCARGEDNECTTEGSSFIHLPSRSPTFTSPSGVEKPVHLEIQFERNLPDTGSGRLRYLGEGSR